MDKEIEEILNKHKEILKESWIMIIVLLVFFANKTFNLEELDNLLTRLENGDTNLLKEEYL